MQSRYNCVASAVGRPRGLCATHPRSSLDARQSHSTTHAGTSLQVERSEPVHAVVRHCIYSINAFPTEHVSCVRLDDIKCTSRKVPRVMMPRAVHVFWSHRGSSLCCPPAARLSEPVNFATMFGRGCVCALYDSLAVRTRRSRLQEACVRRPRPAARTL
jgi:hypothetical protein